MNLDEKIFQENHRLIARSAAVFGASACTIQFTWHVEGSITISVEQAKALFDKDVVFVDVRNPRLFAKGHITSI